MPLPTSTGSAGSAGSVGSLTLNLPHPATTTRELTAGSVVAMEMADTRSLKIRGDSICVDNKMLIWSPWGVDCVAANRQMGESQYLEDGDVVF